MKRRWTKGKKGRGVRGGEGHAWEWTRGGVYNHELQEIYIGKN